MAGYDELSGFPFKAGRGYDKRSVEEFRAKAMSVVDDLLSEATRLRNDLHGLQAVGPTPLTAEELQVLAAWRDLTALERSEVLRRGLRVSYEPPRQAMQVVFDPFATPGSVTPEVPAPSPVAVDPFEQPPFVATNIERTGTVAVTADPGSFGTDPAAPAWSDESWLASLSADASGSFDFAVADAPQGHHVAADIQLPPPIAFPAPAAIDSAPQGWFIDAALGTGQPEPPLVDPEWFGKTISAPIEASIVDFPPRPEPAPRMDDERLDALFDQLDFGRPTADVLATFAGEPALHEPPLTVRSAPSGASPLPEPVRPWAGWVSY